MTLDERQSLESAAAESGLTSDEMFTHYLAGAKLLVRRLRRRYLGALARELEHEITQLERERIGLPPSERQTG